MNQYGYQDWRDREIWRLEDSARHDDARANALDSDARELRRQAETARKTAEYLRKSRDTAAANAVSPLSQQDQMTAALTPCHPKGE